MKTCAVYFLGSEGGRTYDYHIHESLGEVNPGEIFIAEARDTYALVEVAAIHATPSKYATKFIFQKVIFPEVVRPVRRRLIGS